MSYKEVNKCRFDGSDLTSIFSLGTHCLSGIFPVSNDIVIESGPLELGFSNESKILQLMHTFKPEQMYGMNYGYRSGLNVSMAKHLHEKVRGLINLVNLQNGDVVLDIGSNDGTLLKAYNNDTIKIGIDPTANKFLKYYSSDTIVVSDFFNSKNYSSVSNRKAKIITSISMFYDLDDIKTFVSDVVECLDDNGIWHLEQSYAPLMISKNSYDTICHEHIEYYTLTALKKIFDHFNLKIIDISTNDVNGGSFAVTVCKNISDNFIENVGLINWYLDYEKYNKFDTLQPYFEFFNNIVNHKKMLLDVINKINDSGKTIYGYGASTKGNTLLQYCGLNSDQIKGIFEINKDKFGCYTPGTKIPIISSDEIEEIKPDYMLVLPWHFRDNILNRETNYLKSGGKFIFPFPQIEIIG